MGGPRRHRPAPGGGNEAMRRALWFVSVVTTLGIVGLGPRAMTSVSAQQGQTLGGGASSPEELAQRLLDALEREDLDALRRLRVTESEYKDIILAGTAPAGQPARTLRPDVADYAWKTLDTKSLYYERYLLHEFGGQHYEVKHLSFAKGTADYARYRAHRQLRLALQRDGSRAELATGSIAEVGGRYKFISFIRE
jgi:hypothetical protein